jgi:benzaldehyde dehydrogenase (NAD)
VLTEVEPAMRVWNEEIFGPVAPVIPFSSDEEAIAAGLRTGMVHIGDQTVNDVPGAPFGGTGASGNGGRFGGSANLEEFMRWQWVTERDEPATYPF